MRGGGGSIVIWYLMSVIGLDNYDYGDLGSLSTDRTLFESGKGFLHCVTVFVFFEY